MSVFGRWLVSAGRTLAPALMLAVLATAAPLSRAHAEESAPAPGANQNEPAELIVANRPITTLRATAYGVSPADRVDAITTGLEVLLQRGGPLVVSARPIPEGLAIQIDGKFVFRILNGDANQEAGETPAMAADAFPTAITDSDGPSAQLVSRASARATSERGSAARMAA